jgi:uncharacterized membrane protein YedE/YeeE
MVAYFIAYRWIGRRSAPLFAAKFSIPTRNDIDASLILDSALFGAGWDLSGFCPGPAITSLASGAVPVVVFVAAMAVGVISTVSAGTVWSDLRLGASKSLGHRAIPTIESRLTSPDKHQNGIRPERIALWFVRRTVRNRT